MIYWQLALSFIIGYVFGMFKTGPVLAKVRGIDLSKTGSGNTGMTNTMRALGKKVGIWAFVGDTLKVIIPVFITYFLFAKSGQPYPHGVHVLAFIIVTAFGGVLGDMFPFYNGFKGGKGVATSLGVILMVCPIAGILCLITFYLVLKLTGYVSLASTFATITVFTTTWLLHFVGIDSKNFIEYFINKIDLTTCILVSLMALLIILKHIKNYKRLINGTENSFKKKKEIKQ